MIQVLSNDKFKDSRQQQLPKVNVVREGRSKNKKKVHKNSLDKEKLVVKAIASDAVMKEVKEGRSFE